MAYSYDDILRSQAQRLEALRAEKLAELEAARVNEDAERVTYAADAILELDGQYERLAKRANAYVAQQQPQPAQLAGADELSRRDVELATKYGLTSAEIGVAKGWTSDPKMSDEARVQGYVTQRQRYRVMRQTGEYRDDQGTVKR
jgi:hypothetical protein